MSTYLGLADGQAVTMIWDGSEFITPGADAASVAGGWITGATLAYASGGSGSAGIGSVWNLIVSDGSGDTETLGYTLTSSGLEPIGDYDPVMQINTAAENYSDTYSYDLVGNRMKKIHVGPGGGSNETITYTYNNDDELTKQVSNIAGETDFTYDANGSLVTQVSHTVPHYTVHPDGSFASSGIAVTTFFNGEWGQVTAEAVNANGDILVAGQVGNPDDGDNGEMFIAEYLPDGTLNTSFGSGGVIFAGVSSWASGITVLADGSILVTGGYQQTDDDPSQLILAKFHANGTLDASFGSAGTGMVFTTLGSTWDSGSNLTVLSNGDVLVVGFYQGHAILAEYHANGTLNTSFGTSGIASSSSSSVLWNSVVALPNGNILVSGSNVAEYDSTGHLVTSFGTSGVVSASANTLTLLANGEFLLAGASGNNLLVSKYAANGTIDTSFGSNGTVTTPIGSSGQLFGLSVLASGDILVAGTNLLYADGNMLLAEYTADGSLDTTFSSNGISLISLANGATAYTMMILPNGEILLGGSFATNGGEGGAFVAKYEVSNDAGSYSNGTVTTTYTYDLRGKLIKVAVNGNVVATYTYDDFGNRVSETIGGVTTLYLIDTKDPTGYDQPLEARNSATGKLVMTYLLGDRVFGQVDPTGTVSYMLADGHGSTRLLINGDGAGTAAFNYDAFGGALNFSPGMASTAFLFGGDSFYDAPSGLYFHGDGVRTRDGFFFMEQDFGLEGQGTSLDPISLHKYLYAGANPINYLDPSGHNIVAAGLDTISIGLTGVADVLGSRVTILGFEMMVGDAIALTGTLLVIGLLVAAELSTGGHGASLSISFGATSTTSAIIMTVRTGRVGQIAAATGLSEDEVRRRIHAAKNKMRGINPKNRNPDVTVDTETGDIYIGDDVIGNIYD